MSSSNESVESSIPCSACSFEPAADTTPPLIFELPPGDFIFSRYRKEHTGSLDEVQITEIRDELNHLKELRKRQEYILKTIDEQGKLTPELRRSIEECLDPVHLEDIYLPYKVKQKKTRATVA